MKPRYRTYDFYETPYGLPHVSIVRMHYTSGIEITRLDPMFKNVAESLVRQLNYGLITEQEVIAINPWEYQDKLYGSTETHIS
jgi:hypothetical protein